MPKIVLFTLSLTVIVLTASLILLINSNTPGSISQSEIDTAVAQAQYFYRQKKMRGEDFSNGPCLTNDLLPGWVLDIVHNPRVEIDDFSQNQCAAFLEGRAKHFVELDPEGSLVRIQ